MNYKQLVKKVIATEKATLIDKQEAGRGYNKVRFLRFFFCGKFEALVEKFNAIGFYVMIEKTLHNEYDLRAFWITKEQEQGEDFFTEIRIISISKGYNQLLTKLNELLEIKEVIEI